VLNTCLAARDSRKGQSPEVAARRNGSSRKWRRDRREKRHAGSSVAETHADTFREGNASKGAIPRALSARNKAGAGSEGVSRQEGNQTLEAERSGTWKARGEWTSGSSSAEGSKSPREEPAAAARPARVRWAKLYRELNSTRGCGDRLERRSHGSVKEKPHSRGNG
jgi:hypothetical protein